jgi:hypothetical protein
VSTAAHEFFLASAGVAGALIGLLFVAVSVARESLADTEAAEIHSIRASAALTAFTNSLTVSLFGLVPGSGGVGLTASILAVVGLLFVGGALFQVIPAWHAGRVRLKELMFLVGLVAVFVIQLIAGLGLHDHAGDTSDLRTICYLVIVCFLIGIARAWELVGGPNISLNHELIERLRAKREANSARGKG